IDAVVLRRLARARVAADDRWAVYRDRQFCFERVNLYFGQILRLFVEVAKTFLMAQLSFKNLSGAKTRDIASRNVMITTEARQSECESVNVARAFDDDEHRRLALDRQIVNRREMKENRGLRPRTF